MVDLLPDRRALGAQDLAKLRAKIWDITDILALLPPHATFSRLRHKSHRGPAPARDSTWPRGKPTLRASQQQAVQDESAITDYCCALLADLRNRPVTVMLQAPEDLGRTPRGTPASIWRWPALRALPDDFVQRGAIVGSDWSETSSRHQPTGVLTNAAHLIQDRRFYAGWPAFENAGHYQGPAPSAKSMLDEAAPSTFSSSACLQLAALLMNSWFHLARACTGKTLAVGKAQVQVESVLCQGSAAGLAVVYPQAVEKRVRLQPAVRAAAQQDQGHSIQDVGAFAEPPLSQLVPSQTPNRSSARSLVASEARQFLCELRPQLTAALAEASSLASSDSGILELGLQRSANGEHLLKEVDCAARPLFSLVNTSLAESLKLGSGQFNWT